MKDRLKALIPQLAHHHVLVLGDIILDEYITGYPERISREAPIPVLELQSRQYIPGGAANPAANIVALGSQVLQVGIVGDDDAAMHLREQLHERGIDIKGLVIDSDKPTTLKTRILAQMGLRFPQQIARIDTISRQNIGHLIEAALLQRLQKHIDQMEAILVSDYQNGLLTPALIQLVMQVNDSKVPLIVDAQGALDKYIGFDVVKCNARDAATYLQRKLNSADEYQQAALTLAQTLAVKEAMIITRGADGATIANQQTAQHIQAPHISDVFDTVGAGDTWVAVFTLAYISGADLVMAATLAHYASGIVVRHVGNYTPSPQELSDTIEQ